MKAFKFIFLLFSFLCCVISFTSCSKLMGYSIVLWSIPQTEITDGTLVPVYIKSNISHVYVIGIPETDRKLEVPLWQISEPDSKKHALQFQTKYQEYQRQYAKVKLDGLPIRFEPVNTARQVYRLRQDEIIRILYKGTGASVMTGKSSLNGDWYRVLTNDGTEGWCFSYNLTIFDEREGIQQTSEVVEENDELFQDLLNSIWYPDNYVSMINSNRVDLLAMNPDYNFKVDLENEEILMNISGLQLKYPYKGYTKINSKVYQFNETSLTLTIRTLSTIVIQYVDTQGKPASYTFCKINSDINEVIEAEKNRRVEVYNQLVEKGPRYRSSNYGTLLFTGDFNFKWTDYQLLSSLISTDSLSDGKVSFNYFLSKDLLTEFDGMLTLTFQNNGRRINFLYKIEENGLRLEDAQKAIFKESLVKDRSINPIIIFFEKK